jgi:acyl-CoA synthetase (AMP-forming)/AMP-acid ligase II/3-hydroxymyristoyl/3-hydroxydecanoyl-(acyl carrier protein) dehydratase
MLDFAAAVSARPAGAIVGWREGVAVPSSAFLARAQAWRALALRTPGRSLALYQLDSIEFGAALLGAWQAGKTVWLAADQLPATCAALAARVDAFFGDFPAGHAPQAEDLCTLPFAALPGDFEALVVHTSGSTGAAQAIPKRLFQLAHEVATLEAQFGAMLGDAAVVATVSHQHIYGLLFKVLWPLAAGRAIHAHSQAYPEQFAALMAQGPCVLVASPAHLKRLPVHIDWQGSRAALRAVFSSGGPLPLDAALAAAALLGQVPTEIYGSSETGGVAWRRQHAATPGAWRPLPGVAWRVADGGQLEISSPFLADAGWMTLADRAQGLDAASFLLLGRSDRIVKIEEKRISLDAIEACLLAGPLVREVRVMPVEEGGRMVVAAFVVLSPEGQAMLDKSGKHAVNTCLRAALAGSVETVALPRRWRYLDRLPADAQGKTTHALLSALLDGGLDERPRLPRVALLEQQGDKVLLEVTVPARLFYFDGHFAQAPVLPGVVQLDWAIHFGRQYFALGAQFRAIHALKFQQVIRPEAPVLLELLHDSAKSSLAFRFYSDAGSHAGGRILFEP